MDQLSKVQYALDVYGGLNPGPRSDRERSDLRDYAMLFMSGGDSTDPVPPSVLINEWLQFSHRHKLTLRGIDSIAYIDNVHYQVGPFPSKTVVYDLLPLTWLCVERTTPKVGHQSWYLLMLISGFPCSVVYDMFLILRTTPSMQWNLKLPRILKFHCVQTDLGGRVLQSSEGELLDRMRPYREWCLDGLGAIMDVDSFMAVIYRFYVALPYGISYVPYYPNLRRLFHACMLRNSLSEDDMERRHLQPFYVNSEHYHTLVSYDPALMDELFKRTDWPKDAINSPKLQKSVYGACVHWRTVALRNQSANMQWKEMLVDRACFDLMSQYRHDPDKPTTVHADYFSLYPSC